MNTLRHSIDIHASKEKVWQVLWDDKTFRDWANLIDEGTYLVGDLQEGAEVHFMSAGGYGVTSKVEKLIPYEHVSFRQMADIKVGANGALEKRDKQWEGGMETYDLEEQHGKVTLSVAHDVPDELVEYFEKTVPKVLERIKILSEQ